MTLHPPGAAEAAADMAGPVRMTNREFTMLVALVARRAAAWSHDLMFPVDDLDEPPTDDVRQRFVADIRYATDRIAPARQDAQAPAPEFMCLAKEIRRIVNVALEHKENVDRYALCEVNCVLDEIDKLPPASPTAPALSGVARDQATDIMRRLSEKRALEIVEMRERMTHLEQVVATRNGVAGEDGGEVALLRLLDLARKARDEARAEVARLRFALEPFAKAAEKWNDVPGTFTSPDVQLWQNGERVDYITVGDLRNARAAVNAAPPAPDAAREVDLEPGLRHALAVIQQGYVQRHGPGNWNTVVVHDIENEIARLSGSRADGGRDG